MSFNHNKNLKIIGFFGQSGSGKTTIIRNVAKTIGDQYVLQNTGIIRYLFKKNSKSYTDPQKMIKKNADLLESVTNKDDKKHKIDAIYEDYIRSQFRLLNDWSTEIYEATTETHHYPSILLVDRSPIDFYVLTICGMKVLTNYFKKEPNDACKWLIYLIKKTAEDNTNNFLNAVFVTKPWKSSDINKLKDGIRDQYLQDEYTDKNWYSRFKDVKLTETQKFEISDKITDLKERATLVEEKLSEL